MCKLPLSPSTSTIVDLHETYRWHFEHTCELNNSLSDNPIVLLETKQTQKSSEKFPL